jgi:hypothetical protein
MDRPQLIRRLRIAASVFFAAVTVALCVLWVRSHWMGHSWELGFGTTSARCVAVVGQIGAGVELRKPGQWIFDFDLYWLDNDVRQKTARLTTYGFGYIVDPNLSLLIVPLWLPIGVTATTAWACGCCQIHQFRRFSLRTLLIATTLVAVVLGLGVWAAG